MNYGQILVQWSRYSKSAGHQVTNIFVTVWCRILDLVTFSPAWTLGFMSLLSGNDMSCFIGINCFRRCCQARAALEWQPHQEMLYMIRAAAPNAEIAVISEDRSVIAAHLRNLTDVTNHFSVQALLTLRWDQWIWLPMSQLEPEPLLYAASNVGASPSTSSTLPLLTI